MRIRKLLSLVFLLFLASCQQPLTDAPAINWPDWNNETPEPHVVFGEPVYRAHDPNHLIIRKYEAFTVYYDENILSPRWTAIKMTHDVADKNNHVKRQSRFMIDTILKQKGFDVTSHNDYKNPPGSRKWNRGHMVQFDDARGYGKKAAEESFYSTNVCPQLASHNQRGWLALEQLCTEFARDYNVVWIYTGPIYGKNKEPFAEGRKIPRPTAFYKIVVSVNEDSKEIKVLAFKMPHKPIPRNTDLSKYLVSVREIENETKIDFLHELPDEIENPLETKTGKIWPDLPNIGHLKTGS